jgi:hypothetical protein
MDAFNGIIENDLNTKTLSSGIYFVCITNDTKVIRGSFVRE